jgi:hypothetical protein
MRARNSEKTLCGLVHPLSSSSFGNGEIYTSHGRALEHGSIEAGE